MAGKGRKPEGGVNWKRFRESKLWDKIGPEAKKEKKDEISNDNASSKDDKNS
jgi:hypothetical protein